MLCWGSISSSVGLFLCPKRLAGIFINETDIFKRVFLVHCHHFRRLRSLAMRLFSFAVASTAQSPTARHLRVDVPFFGLILVPGEWLCFVFGSMCLVLRDIAVAYRLLNIYLALVCIRRASSLVTFLA